MTLTTFTFVFAKLVGKVSTFTFRYVVMIAIRTFAIIIIIKIVNMKPVRHMQSYEPIV